MSRFQSVARAGAVVGAASVASRLLGFARDILIAGVLGAGTVADAFLVAFRIPNVIRRVLGEGGLNAGFVPVYGDVAARKGAEAAREFAGRTIVNAALCLTAIAGLAEIVAGALVLFVAAGFRDDPGKLALAIDYTRLTLPFVALTGLASLLAALLNAERRFVAAAVAPALVNGVLIVALLLLHGRAEDDPATGIWLALAISFSGLLHLVIVGWAVARMPHRPHLQIPHFDADSRRLARFAVPALLASGMTQIILLATMALASDQPSAVSWLYYADRVFQLPLSFIGVAAGVVLLPEFVDSQRDGASALAPALTRYLTGALALALPAAAGLIALGPSIVTVLFERGAFGPADSRETALLLVALATGLPAACASKILIQPFFARRTVWPPLVAGLAGMLVTLACGHALPRLMTDAAGLRFLTPATSASFSAVGLAASLGLWTQMLVLVIFARAEIVWDAASASRLARLGLAAAVMGLIVAAADGVAAPWLGAEWPLAVRGGILAALCGGGMLVYLLALRLSGVLDALPIGRAR